MISKEDQTSLIWLWEMFESHYVIMFKDNMWMARRLDHPTEIMTAGTAVALRDLINADLADLRSRIGRQAEGGSL